MFNGKALKEEVDRWPNSYFVFAEDGTATIYDMYSDIEIMGVNDDGSEISEPMHWTYKPDEKDLIINDVTLKVLSTEGDTIRLLRDTTNSMLYNIDKTYTKLKKGPGMCLGG